jgi:hypothetical protein
LPRAGASVVLDTLQTGEIELLSDKPNGFVRTSVDEITANPRVLEAGLPSETDLSWKFGFHSVYG